MFDRIWERLGFVQLATKPKQPDERPKLFWKATFDPPGEPPMQVIGVWGETYQDAYNELELRYGKGTVRFLTQAISPWQEEEAIFERGYNQGRRDQRLDRSRNNRWLF